MPLGGGKDRPVVAAAERRLLHRQHENLHEASVGGAALDLLDGVLDVLHRDDDRCAQARIAVEPFFGDKVIERAGEGARHVLVVDELHAVEAIKDRVARAPAVAHLRGDLRRVGRRVSVGSAEIRARGDRGIRRIGGGFERAHAALLDRVAPVGFEIRQQNFVVRDSRMHVAVDGVHVPIRAPRTTRR